MLVSTTFAAAAASFSSQHQRTIAFVNPSAVPRYEHSTSSSQLFAIPGVSSLTPETTSTFLQQHQSSGSSSISTILSPQAIAASASISLTYLSLLLAFDRPRGRLTIPDAANSLVINQSRVPNAGLGLFLSKSYPEGTVLGTYPGVLRPAEQFYSTKCRMYPQAVGYSWRFTDSKYVLDPTDDEGNIDMYCYGGGDTLSNMAFKTILSFMRVGTELTRINEPPIGAGGCNVSARENLERREVVFTLCRNVVAGEELFLDYGLDYDRSNYAPRPE
eukprot:scaffold366_cov153-Skeletonema_menzelii.AAC.16